MRIEVIIIIKNWLSVSHTRARIALYLFLVFVVIEATIIHHPLNFCVLAITVPEIQPGDRPTDGQTDSRVLVIQKVFKNDLVPYLNINLRRIINYEKTWL